MANELTKIPKLGMFNEPQSLRQLTRGRGFTSELAGFLLPFARQDYIYKEFDFQESAITDDPNTMWTLADSGGTATGYTTDANAEEGTISGATGTTDNAGVAIHYDAISSNADKNPGMHVYMKIDDVSEAGLEIGYSDAKTNEHELGVTDIDTPALGNGVTDGAFICYDTDSTIPDGMSLVAGGATDTDAVVGLSPSYSDTSTSTTAATLTDTDATWTIDQWIGFVVTATATGYTATVTGNSATVLSFSAWSTPGDPSDTIAYTIVGTGASPITDAVFFNARLQVYANAAWANVDAGTNATPEGYVTGAGLSVGPDADVLMRPSIVCVTRDTGTVLPTIDLIRIWRNRV